MDEANHGPEACRFLKTKEIERRRGAQGVNARARRKLFAWTATCHARSRRVSRLRSGRSAGGRSFPDAVQWSPACVPAPAHALRLECFFVLARTSPWSPRRLSLAAGETGGHINSCPARWRDINQSPLHPHNHLTLPSTYLPTYLPLPLPILTTSQPLLPHLPHPLCPFHITVADNSLRSLHITYKKKNRLLFTMVCIHQRSPFPQAIWSNRNEDIVLEKALDAQG